MSTLPLPSDEEIHAAYQQGARGVIAPTAQLVRALLTIFGQQQEVIDQQQATLQRWAQEAAAQEPT